MTHRNDSDKRPSFFDVLTFNTPAYRKPPVLPVRIMEDAPQRQRRTKEFLAALVLRPIEIVPTPDADIPAAEPTAEPASTQAATEAQPAPATETPETSL